MHAMSEPYFFDDKLFYKKIMNEIENLDAKINKMLGNIWAII